MILLNSGRIVIIAAEVVRKVQSFAVSPGPSTEAGGILLGSYRGPHVEIIDCTAPLPKDKRTMFGFLRRDPGHSAKAIAAWKSSGLTTAFVGEWHTHPEDDPTPSQIDLATWHKLMRTRRLDPLIFLIAGRKALYCDLGLEDRLRRLQIISE